MYWSKAIVQIVHWGLAALCMVIALQANAALIVDIKPSAVQQRAQVSVADISELRGDAREVEQARNILLPARGRVGDIVVYTRNDILKAALQQAPRLAAQYQMIGANRISVKREGHALSAAEYVSYAKQGLAACLANVAGDIEIRPKGEYGDLLIPLGISQLRSRCGGTELRTAMQITLDIVVDDVVYRSIPVVFEVAVYRPVMRLNRTVEMHSEVTGGMVDLRAANIAGLTSVALNQPEQYMGQWTRRRVEAGAVLQLNDLEKKPDVIAGDLLNVAASVGGVTVQTKAIAERSGFIGQRISAHLARSDERLMVEIFNKGLAIVTSAQMQQ